MLAEKQDKKLVFDALKLIRSENLGPRTYHTLLEYYKTPTNALSKISELANNGGLKRHIKIADDADIINEIENCNKSGVEILVYGETLYPKQLLDLHDAPPVLFAKGNLALLNRTIVSIVGARNASTNGLRMAREMSDRFARKEGYVVCSGLASGIDTAAHIGASSKSTIAVLAGGVDHVFPIENAELHKQISNDGLLISERPLCSKPMAMHFSQRNRIISGLSLALVVVEASEKSGSLITAKYAQNQRRRVYAVPSSPLDKRYTGCNNLIKEGSAFLLSDYDDVVVFIDAMNSVANDVSYHSYKTSSVLSIDQQELIRIRNALKIHIGYTEVEVNQLLVDLKTSYPNLNMALVELELAGKIERIFPNKVVRIAE
jgi:DNA processing protein